MKNLTKISKEDLFDKLMLIFGFLAIISIILVLIAFELKNAELLNISGCSIFLNLFGVIVCSTQE